MTIANGLPAAGTAMFPQFGYPNNLNTVVLHRHGGLQAASSDGAPDQAVAPGGSRINHYPNDQAAAPLWYHDHADRVTSYNVYAGLAGFMPNTDRLEPRFNLPAGDFAKAYVLQDKSFNADHTLCYTHASPEFFGDLPVVNGTIAPKQTVQPPPLHLHVHQRLRLPLLPPDPDPGRWRHRGCPPDDRGRLRLRLPAEHGQGQRSAHLPR